MTLHRRQHPLQQFIDRTHSQYTNIHKEANKRKCAATQCKAQIMAPQYSWKELFGHYLYYVFCVHLYIYL